MFIVVSLRASGLASCCVVMARRLWPAGAPSAALLDIADSIARAWGFDVHTDPTTKLLALIAEGELEHRIQGGSVALPAAYAALRVLVEAAAKVPGGPLICRTAASCIGLSPEP